MYVHFGAEIESSTSHTKRRYNRLIDTRKNKGGFYTFYTDSGSNIILGAN